MMETIHRCLWLFILCATAFQMATANGLTSLGGFNGANYYYSLSDDTFSEAKSRCEDAGYYLAVPDDKDLNTWLYNELLSVEENSTFWIGLVKRSDSCQYRTYNGQRVPRWNNFVATTNFDQMWCATLQVFPFWGYDYQPIFMNGEWYGRLCNTTHGVVCQQFADKDCPGYCTYQGCDDYDASSGDVSQRCKENCAIQDDCPNSPDPPERDLENFCFWQPYPRVDTFEHALKTCQYGGGTVLNVLSEREYVYFRTRGFFKACTVWDQYFLGLYQKPGTGAARWTYNGRVCTLGEVFAPYWGYSMFNLIKYDYGLNFWSSQDKAGIVMVLQAKTETAAMLNIAPVVLDSPSTHSKFERRRPRFALYWCEARKESFCMANAPDIPNARKHYANCDNPTYQCDDYAIILYTCKSGFEFPDGSTYKRVRCTCDYKEFKRQIPADGCRPIDRCGGPNPCDHFCLGYTGGNFRCACRSGFKLGSNGKCIDIDECSDPHYESKCPTAPYGGCRNTYGGYLCFCNIGYNMDSRGSCQSFGGGKSVDHVIILIYIYKTADPGSYGVYNREDPYHENILIGLKAYLQPSFKSTPESFELREIKPYQHGIICCVIKVNLYTKIPLKDQGYLYYSIHKRINDPSYNTLPINGVSHRIFPECRVETEGGLIITITTACSLYEALDYCPSKSSRCEVRHYYPYCVCLDGYVDYNGRCELKDREKKDDKWTAIEIFLFVSVIVLIVMVLCLCICICSLCAKTSRGRVSAVYDHGPAFSGIKTAFHSNVY